MKHFIQSKGGARSGNLFLLNQIEGANMMTIDKFKGQYQFLSNFYPVIITINDESYPSAEHAFQAMKSLDKDERIAMSVCRSAAEAKKAGKLVNLRKDWEQIKVGIMYQILKSKFENPELAQKLRDTKDAILEENNTWGDTFWGKCNGIGSNMLGQLLMQVRSEING